MVQKEKSSFFIALSVIIVVCILAFISSVVGIAEDGFSASPTLESYSNSKFGVNLEHPSDWKVAYLKNGFQLIKEKNVVYLEMRKHNLESSGVELEKFVDDDINDRSSSRDDFKLLNKTQTTISGNLPAYKALYTFLKTKNQKDFATEETSNKILRIYTLAKGNVYIVAYVSDENKFDVYLPTVEKIIDSLKIKGSEKSTNATTESDNNNLGQINKKYLQEDSVKNATGPTTSSQEAGEPVLKHDNVTQTTAGGDQIYENSTLGIRILYPSNWEKIESADSVRFVSPKEDMNDKYPQRIDLFTYPSMSLNQAIESLTNYYKTTLTNFSSAGSPHASVAANSSSISFMYSFNDSNIGPLRSMDFIVSPEGSNKTFLFTFRDEASSFEKDLPEAQRILDSINFLR
jgi:hypothetical protein